MTANEQDWAVIFNIKRIEEAVKNGEFKEMNGVPVVDGRNGSPYTRYIPISNSPHGINTAPDGIHVAITGKLSPTVTVMDVRLLDDVVRRQDQAARRASSRNPSWASGRSTPPMTARGNAYTTLFLDSQVCKWNIEKAKRAFKGEKVDPIVQKLDVHYQPGHNHTLDGPDQGGRRQVADLAEQVLQGPLPQRGPAEARERSADRHLGRRDEARP